MKIKSVMIVDSRGDVDIVGVNIEEGDLKKVSDRILKENVEFCVDLEGVYELDDDTFGVIIGEETFCIVMNEKSKYFDSDFYDEEVLEEVNELFNVVME